MDKVIQVKIEKKSERSPFGSSSVVLARMREGEEATEPPQTDSTSHIIFAANLKDRAGTKP